ncbi:MAG: PorP/SprF family type IX secretion system membrane protein [Flavobacteriales bacterium]
MLKVFFPTFDENGTTKVKPFTPFYLVFFFVGLMNLVGFGQDPEFTQFFNNPIHLNPAFAGAYGLQEQPYKAPRLILSHRNQWPSMSGQYVTSGVTVDGYVRGMQGGLAFRAMTDDAARGTLTSTYFGIAYSYRTEVSQKWRMNLALDAGFFQRHLDWNKLSFRDMIDPGQGFIFATQDIYRAGQVSGADFKAGGIVYSDKWTFGVAASHLNQPNESVAGGTSTSIIPIKFTGHVAGTISIKDKPRMQSNLRPMALFHNQGIQNHFVLGANFDVEQPSTRSSKFIFSSGFWYRGIAGTTYRDAFMAYFGFETEGWKFGYSYDLTASQLTPRTGGAHEITFIGYGRTNDRRKAFCPGCDEIIRNQGEMRIGRFGTRSNYWNGQRIKRKYRAGN